MPDYPDATLTAPLEALLLMATEPLSALELAQAVEVPVAEVTAAWADSRVFREGRWRFDELPPELQHLRTLHYVAGGQFYTTGAATAAPASSPAPATDAA